MHLVQTMAYVNEVPWHGLGQQLAPNQPLEVWAERAGMNWQIEAADVRFAARGVGLDAICTFPDQKVLYRSDTKAPLAIVSKRYQVVQPAEILEFYRDSVDPMWSKFYQQTLRLNDDGTVSPPDVPGIGADPNYAALAPYRVA